MDILSFLNILENTLENIEVKGKSNISRMMGIFLAIDNMQKSLGDGEDNGRQTDIGTDTSINDNAE